MLYYAEIEEFEQLPQLEIERIDFLDILPADLKKWTYSAIQPKLADKIKEYLNIYL